MDVTAAYRTLKDPVRRAEALLALRGRTVGENDKANPALLMEVMDLRESLSETRQNKDVAALLVHKEAMGARKAKLVAKLTAAFANDETDAAQEALLELRYVTRFLDEVAAIEEELS